MREAKITVFLVFRQLKSKNRLQKRVQREKLALAHSGEVTEGGGELHIAVWSCNFLKMQNVRYLAKYRRLWFDVSEMHS